MQITIAAATRLELREAILKQTNKQHTITILYTGVGILASAVSLTQHALLHKPQLIIQAGIAGSFNDTCALGEVVVVQRECVGDMGVVQHAQWKDMFSLGFIDANEAPYEMRYLPNNWTDKYNVLKLPKARGVTVNQISTDERTIANMKTAYYGDIETMEGASLHYVCRRLSIPFIQVRAISNYVGERDKSKWKIKEAVEHLNNAVAQMLDAIQ